ncbi:MAG: amidohydrolase family protein [Pyrinomonadaceae bacterium]
MLQRIAVLLLNLMLVGACATTRKDGGDKTPAPKADNAASTSASPRHTLIKAGRMLDVRSGSYQFDRGVLIEGERIKEVGPWAEVQSRAPKDARVIDLGAGMTLLPGLIDCHTHLLDLRKANLEFYENNARRLAQKSQEDHAKLGALTARETVEAGWTTVRDLGDSANKSDLRLRDAIIAGQVVGPRMIVSASKLTPPKGQHIKPEAPVSEEIVKREYLLVNDLEAARRGVRAAADAGADVIKVIVDDGPLVLEPEIVKGIVEEAHRANLKVAAHAHVAASIKIAVEAGADSIEHAYQISDESLRLMKEKGLFLVPTDITPEAVSELLAKSLPPGAAKRPEMEMYAREQVELAPERLRRALRIGVKIAAGSDLAWDWPGTTRGQQSLLIIDAYRSAGMSPLDIIRAATLNAADLLGWQDRIGVIEANKYADVIAVEGDPLENIADLKRVVFVLKGGVVLKEVNR